MKAGIQIIMAFLGALGFCMLYNLHGKKAFWAAFGGGISWAFFLFLTRWSSNDVLLYFYSAMFATVYSEIMARVEKSPVTLFLIPGIIPMIPGGSLYYTMNYAVSSELDQFVTQGMYTLSLAGALAAGILCISSVSRLVFAFPRRIVRWKNGGENGGTRFS